MSHKCPECKARGHRAGYCPKCAAVYRKVCRWSKLYKDDRAIDKRNTPYGFVYVAVEPDAEVVAWLRKRNKLPDMQAVRDRAFVLNLKALLATAG